MDPSHLHLRPPFEGREGKGKGHYLSSSPFAVRVRVREGPARISPQHCDGRGVVVGVGGGGDSSWSEW